MVSENLIFDLDYISKACSLHCKNLQTLERTADQLSISLSKIHRWQVFHLIDNLFYKVKLPSNLGAHDRTVSTQW